MSIFIEGIGISEYRSFGTEIQRIGPFQKINLFIGQNNSGKSNILRYLVYHHDRDKVDFAEFDRHLGSTSDRMKFARGIQPASANLKKMLVKYHPRLKCQHFQWITEILASRTLTHETELAWFDYTSAWDADTELDKSFVEPLRAENVLTDHQWQELRTKLIGQEGSGDIIHDWIPGVARALNRAVYHPCEITLVPAIRQIDASDAKDHDFSGAGLIDRLARLQNPDTDREESKNRFDEINRFLQNVTGSDDAMLEIPYSRDEISVQMGGKTLPLQSLGMGIHEVIILAAAATVLHDQVLCLEEPEIHLHPTLQRKLLQYLSEHTDNQYFIATHSAHLLNVEDVAVFHVSLEDGQSKVRRAIDSSDKAKICADLGYKASDLLQANCILWVEGPSDRIYLNHWLLAANSDLIEGLHYSIMFYGGRLLSHLTADDPEVNDFISLRRLNRNIAILVDSDRDKKYTKINETKQRIRKEFDQGPGFAWVTQGREIENYIDPKLLQQAITEVHPRNVDKLSKCDQYSNCLQYKAKTGKKVTADKVKVARRITESPANLDVLDLRKQINRLERFILTCNR